MTRNDKSVRAEAAAMEIGRNLFEWILLSMLLIV